MVDHQRQTDQFGRTVLCENIVEVYSCERDEYQTTALFSKSLQTFTHFLLV